MRPTLRMIVAGLAAASLVVAACGGDDDDDGNAAPSAETTVPGGESPDTTVADETPTSLADEGGSDEPATVVVGETDLGPTLVDGEGLTLYVFDNDTAGTSNCSDACATAWPPLTVDGDPVIGDDVDAEAIGTITRADGATQVTYDGMPLYRWSGDSQPGDATGLGVGGVWWPLGADGQKLTGNEQASTGGGFDY